MVGKFTSEDMIAEYVKNWRREKEYKQLLLNLQMGTPSP